MIPLTEGAKCYGIPVRRLRGLVGQGLLEVTMAGRVTMVHEQDLVEIAKTDEQLRQLREIKLESGTARRQLASRHHREAFARHCWRETCRYAGEGLAKQIETLPEDAPPVLRQALESAKASMARYHQQGPPASPLE